MSFGWRVVVTSIVVLCVCVAEPVGFIPFALLCPLWWFRFVDAGFEAARVRRVWRDVEVADFL